MKQGWVYFVRRADGEGPVKIGFSSEPENRAYVLDRSSPTALDLVAKLPGDCELERRFHRLFLGGHIRCEWFEATPELLLVVNSINAGTFDPAVLPEPYNLLNLRPPRKPWTPEQRRRLGESQRRRHAIARQRRKAATA